MIGFLPGFTTPPFSEGSTHQPVPPAENLQSSESLEAILSLTNQEIFENLQDSDPDEGALKEIFDETSLCFEAHIIRIAVNKMGNAVELSIQKNLFCS